ncbi:uncharacterized protein LOC128518708 [Clarias gariepinus]|uniref:uncharacterized protein LOC128518708 n=1 Tax=Clarias gariepinus TaxID=13013 RepID=UPI00234C16A6|nr:uncharacterized protein LOC128518708 [Clarias gariepinus]
MAAGVSRNGHPPPVSSDAIVESERVIVLNDNDSADKLHKLKNAGENEEKLLELNITENEIQKIVKELEQEDLLSLCNEELNVSVDRNEQTISLSSVDPRLTDGHANLTPPQTQTRSPGLSLTRTQNSWISQFGIPWDKIPASLSQALLSRQRAIPADRRAMVRTVVAAMQKHCTNPNRAACIERAKRKRIVSTYPLTFADKTKEGEQLSVVYFSLVNQLKIRVEHVNRNNVSDRIRRPKTMPKTSDVSTTKTVRCTNWQPKCLPEGETVDSLKEKQKNMVAIFQSAGPREASWRKRTPSSF